MSKQDTHFFNVFSLVLGVLIALALLLLGFSRFIGSTQQAEHVRTDPLHLAAVESRIQPFARVAVAGEDNTALAIEQPAQAPGTAGAGPSVALNSGEDVFNAACIACHGQGIAGAPKMGDAAAWGPRIAQGMQTLYDHSIHGYQGSTGVMPPKGGRMDIADDLIRQAVDYMVQNSK